MRIYLVILVVLSVLSCRPAAAQSCSGRVLSIERSAANRVSMTLEIADPDSGELHHISVETGSIPTDIQLNSRVQLDLVTHDTGEPGSNSNTKYSYHATTLRLDRTALHGADKTGVRARMKQAGSGRNRTQHSSHRGRH